MFFNILGWLAVLCFVGVILGGVVDSVQEVLDELE